ncbi:Na+/H+ antiporter NhaC family protein [Anaerotignum faecicola]|jgi:NhaC family Na+:H+ antiporter
MKRKDKKHTALFSAFVLISIALIFIAGLSFHFPTASILVVVLIWLFAVAVFSGMSSQEIENAFVNGAKKGSAAILLLLCVGVIVSMWIQSGMVPMIIYYGLGLFSPQILLLCTFLLCVLLSVCTGSSWGACGTIGIACVSIGEGMGIPAYITAGAAISGATVGDKLSPFSDTTVFTSYITHVNIYDHIRSMMKTTIPTVILTMIIYIVIGQHLESRVIQDSFIPEMRAALKAGYTFHWGLFLLPTAIILMSIKKVPATLSLLLVGLLGGVLSIGLQGNSITQVMEAVYGGVDSSLGIELLDTMLSKGGLISMLPTVCIVLLALAIGGLIGEMGILDVLVVSMRERFQSERAVVLFTILCGIVMVLLLSSLYVSAVLIAELFAAYYDERGIDRSILSRTIEETTTITTPLIPWHSSYLYYTSLFRLNGMQFIPYTVFCWLNLIVSIVLTIFGEKYFLNNKHNGKKEELVC